MKRATVSNTDEARAIVVLAYAHSIMEDLLTDWALFLSERRLPRSLQESEDKADICIEQLGNRFEETFLQGNAPQYSIGMQRNENILAADAVRSDALILVNKWLRAL